MILRIFKSCSSKVQHSFINGYLTSKLIDEWQYMLISSYYYSGWTFYIASDEAVLFSVLQFYCQDASSNVIPMICNLNLLAPLRQQRTRI